MMNNQEAADELQYAIDLIKQDGKDWLDERDIPVLEMAISALQAQDSPKPKAESVQNVKDDDLILRKAAIDAECEVCQIAPKKERGHNCTYYVHGCKEIECLRALPSAQPERETAKFIRWMECKRTADYISYTPHCKCSKCGTEFLIETIKYCYICGARMER